MLVPAVLLSVLHTGRILVVADWLHEDEGRGVDIPETWYGIVLCCTVAFFVCRPAVQKSDNKTNILSRAVSLS